MARERGKTAIESLEYKPADGGVVSETRSKVSRGGSGGGPSYDYDHKTAVHSSLEDAKAHLESCLGHCFAGSKEESVREPDEKAGTAPTD
jgi:hypothetical protein